MHQRHTVLIVDDADLVRRTANRMLTKGGYRVLEAADGDEALSVLSTPGVKVDLVLLDVVLPGTDGVALYADICARWPEMPIVFVSAYSAEVLVTYGQEDLLWAGRSLSALLGQAFHLPANHVESARRHRATDSLPGTSHVWTTAHEGLGTSGLQPMKS
jgi:CheY-like chemotaxis protein